MVEINRLRLFVLNQIKFFKEPFKLTRLKFYLSLFSITFFLSLFSLLVILFIVNSSSKCDGFGCFFSGLLVTALLYLFVISIVLFNLVFIIKYEFENYSIKHNQYIFVIYLVLFLFLFSFIVFDDPFFKNKVEEKFGFSVNTIDVLNEQTDRYLETISVVYNFFDRKLISSKNSNLIKKESFYFEKLNFFIDENNFFGCIDYFEGIPEIKNRDFTSKKDFLTLCGINFSLKENNLSFCDYVSVEDYLCYQASLESIINTLYFKDQLDKNSLINICNTITKESQLNKCLKNYSQEILIINLYDGARNNYRGWQINFPYLLTDYLFLNETVNKEIKDEIFLFNENKSLTDFLHISLKLDFFSEDFLIFKINTTLFKNGDTKTKELYFAFDLFSQKIIDKEDIFN